MMLLSRFWYAVLAVLAAFAIYAVFLAVGQFNRRSVAGANEALASDAAVVRWGLKIDARYRLDALLVGSVDKGVQDACVATILKWMSAPRSDCVMPAPGEPIPDCMRVDLP